MEKEIGHEVRRVSKLIGDYIRNSSDFGYSKMHVFLIGHIYQQNKNVYQKDLEQTFHINKSSCAELIAGIEKEGLIKRVFDERDKRLKKIVLTEEGIRIAKEIEDNKNKLESVMKSNLTDDDMTKFFEIIDIICLNLEKTKC